MAKQEKLDKTVILKVVKLAIFFLKKEGVLKKYIENINKAEVVCISNEKDLIGYMMGDYMSRIYHRMDEINPISHFFIWSHTSEGQDFWSCKNVAFIRLCNRKFREKYATIYGS